MDREMALLIKRQIQDVIDQSGRRNGVVETDPVDLAIDQSAQWGCINALAWAIKELLPKVGEDIDE